MNKLVSVIIPVYNRRELIDNTIKSVLEQQYNEIEVIVVDDGSVPPFRLSDEVKSDSRTKLIRLEKNQGPSAARNAGARASSGQWLAWLDSDDIWASKKLSLQMDFLDNLGSKREITALATGFEYSHPGGQLDKRLPASSSNPFYFFAGCWFCPGSTIVIHRSLFDCVGPYDEVLHRLEDVDWFIRLTMAGGQLAVLPQVLATINAGQSPSYEKVKCAGKKIIAKYKRTSSDIPKSYMKNLISYLQLEYAAAAIKHDRRFIKGACHLVISFFIRPRIRLHLYQFWSKPEL